MNVEPAQRSATPVVAGVETLEVAPPEPVEPGAPDCDCDDVDVLLEPQAARTSAAHAATASPAART